MTRALLTFSLALALGCGDDGTPADGSLPADGSVPPADAAAPPDARADARPPLDAGTDAFGPICERGTLEAGDFEQTLEHGGTTRRYLLHVPRGYDGSEAVPLVFNFHGFTSNATQQLSLSAMNDLADDAGFLAVHPEGTGALQAWNAGVCCGTAASDEVDDVGFVRAMLEAVAATACVDRSRVYATGLSNGGFLSYRLACEASDIIAAIAPVAGVIGVSTEECDPPRAVPVMHFHGTFDTIVPFGGSTLTGFRSVDDTIAHWVDRNGCSEATETTYAMGDSSCETHAACDDGAEVTLCTIEGGGHVWPGGFGSTSTIVATEHMWDFLSRFRLPD